MEFDGVYIVLSLIFSTFGLMYFRYGRRLNKVPWIAIGVILMIYPYFVQSRVWMIVLGILLMLIPPYVWR